MALDPRDAYIAPRHAEAPAPPRPKRKIGEKMPDGTVFAGISPDTNQPMYTTPADVPLTITFHQANKYAAKVDMHGHKDWRVPTKAELNVLFNNRAAIGGFEDSAGWYWSASHYGWSARMQRFSDGCDVLNNKENPAALRCVR